MRAGLPVALAALVTLAGCAVGRTAGSVPPSAVQTSTVLTSTVLTSGEPSSAVEQTVQGAITRFNQTAGGTVAAQQAQLAELVSPGQSSQQKACPKATSTIRLEPVYARLATSPGWRPTAGTLPGTVYALPTLIRIYTGDRLTGTDLTDLHLSINAGHVQFPAVCLR